jgi:hypothetical protein
VLTATGKTCHWVTLSPSPVAYENHRVSG